MNRRILSYPLKALVKDYLRAGAGLLVTLVILAGTDTEGHLLWFFLFVAFLMVYFLATTVLRHMQRIEYDHRGLLLRPRLGGARELNWAGLTGLRLRYWGKRRRDDGILALFLEDGRKNIKIQGDIDGFRDLFQHALGAARKKNLELDGITEDNVKALGRIWGEDETNIDGARP